MRHDYDLDMILRHIFNYMISSHDFNITICVIFYIIIECQISIIYHENSINNTFKRYFKTTTINVQIQ